MGMLLLRIIGIGSLLLALAATGFCAWNYVGPYAWLAEAQMAAMGSYEVQLTFLCTLLGFMLPALIVVIPLRLAMGWQNTQADPSLDLWIRNNRGSLVLGIASPMLLCVAGYFAFDAWSMGTLTPMRVSEVGGGVLPSRYVRMDGLLVPSMARSMEEEHHVSHFVPLSSTGRPPFRVFVETSSDSLPTTPIQGVLYENGLPGPLRDSFTAEGALEDAHWTLSPGRSPDSRWEEALVFFVVGLVLLAMLVAIRVWVFVRGERTA